MFSNLQKYTFHTYFRYEAFSDYCHSSDRKIYHILPFERSISADLRTTRFAFDATLGHLQYVNIWRPFYSLCGTKSNKNQNFIIVAELVKDAFILAFIEEV